MDRSNLSETVLLKVYDAMVQEYRFNVQLAYDRVKFFFGLNAALIAAGASLLNFASQKPAGSFFLTLYFLLSLAISAYSISTIRVGNKYYRNSIKKKILIERELGLLRVLRSDGNNDNLSLSVTSSQGDYIKAIYTAPNWSEEADSLLVFRRTTVLGGIYYIHILMMAIQLMGVFLSFFLFVQQIM